MSDSISNPSGKSRVSVDSGGRILLPKKARQRLGLTAGDGRQVEHPVHELTAARILSDVI